MRHRVELQRRNAELADRYFATVQPRARLCARLLALELTTPEQNVAILRLFDATVADDAEPVANQSVADLLALTRSSPAGARPARSIVGWLFSSLLLRRRTSRKEPLNA